jgi:hypothetical protein
MIRPNTSVPSILRPFHCVCLLRLPVEVSVDDYLEKRILCYSLAEVCSGDPRTLCIDQRTGMLSSESIATSQACATFGSHRVRPGAHSLDMPTRMAAWQRTGASGGRSLGAHSSLTVAPFRGLQNARRSSPCRRWRVRVRGSDAWHE